MSQPGRVMTVTRYPVEADEPRCEAGLVIAGVALAPALALTAVAFLGYTLTESPTSLPVWHPIGQLGSVMTAGTVSTQAWPGLLETLSVLTWRLMLGGIATVALVGVTLLGLDLVGVLRCIPPTALRRISRQGSLWPRLIGFVLAVGLVWSGYNALLLALPQ